MTDGWSKRQMMKWREETKEEEHPRERTGLGVGGVNGGKWCLDDWRRRSPL